MPSKKPASIRRTAGSGSIPGRPADAGRIKVSDLPAQPAEVENKINTGKNVIVGDEITQRTSRRPSVFAPTTRVTATDTMRPP